MEVFLNINNWPIDFDNSQNPMMANLGPMFEQFLKASRNIIPPEFIDVDVGTVLENIIIVWK